MNSTDFERLSMREKGARSIVGYDHTGEQEAFLETCPSCGSECLDLDTTCWKCGAVLEG